MSKKQTVIVLVGAALTAAPQYLGLVPAPYSAVAAAAIALALQIYHLYQPTPSK